MLLSRHASGESAVGKPPGSRKPRPAAPTARKVSQVPPPNPYEDFKRRLFGWVKLPAWLLISFGLFIDISAVKDVAMTAADLIHTLLPLGGVVALIIGNPVFGTALIVFGVLYLIFVGEPKSPLRSRVWPYLAYSTVGILAVAILGLGEAAWIAKKLSPPPRTLTADQKKLITREAVASFGPGLIKSKMALTVFAVQTPEANQYAVQFMRAIVLGHIPVQTISPPQLAPVAMEALDPNVRGVIILVPDEKALPRGAQQLRKVLEDANVPVSIAGAGHLGGMTFNTGGYALLVGFQ